MARQKLENVKLKADPQPVTSDRPLGEVVRQSPDQDVSVDENSTVKLFVSSGPDTVEVPSVAGFPLGDAMSALHEAHIDDAHIVTRNEESSTATAGTVLRTEPPAGSHPKDVTVTLVVAVEPATTTTVARSTTTAARTTTTEAPSTTTAPARTTTAPHATTTVPRTTVPRTTVPATSVAPPTTG